MVGLILVLIVVAAAAVAFRLRPQKPEIYIEYREPVPVIDTAWLVRSLAWKKEKAK